MRKGDPVGVPGEQGRISPNAALTLILGNSGCLITHKNKVFASSTELVKVLRWQWIVIGQNVAQAFIKNPAESQVGA